MSAHLSTFEEMLASGDGIAAPGIHDGLSARLVEQAGFKAAFVSGAGISFARFGRPDMGLVTASEVAESVAIMRERTDMPMIVDMDTGFGNAVNVQRTVRTFGRAGASALQMEDQVLPKRCGHMAGKQVVPVAEMVGKIKAALDARDDDRLKIIARTDAYGVNGFGDAMERAHAYVEAGADILFVEAPKKRSEMEDIGRTFGGRLPLVHNLVEGSGSPIKSAQEIFDIGYRIALFPVAMLHAFVPAARDVLDEIKRVGKTHRVRDRMIDLNEMNDMLGAADLLGTAEKYGDE